MAQKILLVVVETQGKHLVARTLAWQHASHSAGGNALSYVARNRHPTVVARDLITIDHQFDAAVIPVITGLHQAIYGTGVHDIALRVVCTHDVAIRIIKNTGVA